MTKDEDIFDNENLFLLKKALQLSEELDLPFKNRTTLARFCAHLMSSEKAAPPVSISTLTRNPIYRALLDKRLLLNTRSYDFEAIELRLEVSRLRKDNARKELYIASLDRPPIEHNDVHKIIIQAPPDLSSNYLVKIVDLLLDCFADHICIDPISGEFVRPYLTSSARVVVPRELAKFYLKYKNDLEGK